MGPRGSKSVGPSIGSTIQRYTSAGGIQELRPDRMRSSTILLLSLRSLAHETIKNLVLAGIGRLIIMDDGKVTEEDLSSGFLFREEEGAVGKLVSSLPYTSR